MIARVFLIISVHAVVSSCVTVNLFSETPKIISKSKVELTPILITSGLNDIVVLSAPILNAQAIYYLHKPNGDALRLNLQDTEILTNNVLNEPQFKILNVNNESFNATDEVATAEAKLTPYDFMVGPLQEEDHGNWVLSAYFKDVDGNWIEFFQVITMEIIETVPLSPEESELNIGDTFVLSFAYPLRDLETCQIDPPRSTVDRYYDRAKTGLNKCEFIMKNVTLADDGTWTIIGISVALQFRKWTDDIVRNQVNMDQRNDYYRFYVPTD